MLKNYLKEAWRELVGDEMNFSVENREFNTISVVTLLLLTILLPLNTIVSLPSVTLVMVVLLVVQAVVYYLSRFRKKFRFGIAIYATVSYAAVIAIYYFNSGIYGPGIVAFLITFLLLTAFTEKSTHAVWLTLHTLLGLALLTYDYLHPTFVKNSYNHPADHYLDMAFTYIISIVLIYLITIYLRNIYTRERKVAEERAEAISLQNKRLQEIAWIQSHAVRNHVATIMGLMQLFNHENASDPINADVLDKLKEASANLDKAIKEIDSRTKTITAVGT